MGQPAARVGDLHICPMITPGLPPIPHVGGPILPPGGINVLIGGLPAATLGGTCVCVGPPDVIVRGSFTVLIGGRPAVRMGDNTLHGGAITLGFPTVLIGDFGMGEVGVVTPEMLNTMFMAALDIAGVTQDTSRQQVLDGKDGGGGAAKSSNPSAMKAIADAKVMLKKKQDELALWDDKAKANVKTWMGDDSEATRTMLQDRIKKEQALLDTMDEKNFKPGTQKDLGKKPKIENTWAYVIPNDTTHTVYLGGLFDDPATPDTGQDSRAGTLVHELSHFDDVGGTKDVVYGADDAKNLAKKKPADAQKNADNFEYYMEN